MVPSTSTWARAPELKMSTSTTVCPPDVVLDPPVGVGGGDPAGDTLGVGLGLEAAVGLGVPLAAMVGLAGVLAPVVASGNGFWNGSRPEKTRTSPGEEPGEGCGGGETTAPGTPPDPSCSAESGEPFVPAEERMNSARPITSTGTRIITAFRSRGERAIGQTSSGTHAGAGAGRRNEPRR